MQIEPLQMVPVRSVTAVGNLANGDNNQNKTDWNDLLQNILTGSAGYHSLQLPVFCIKKPVTGMCVTG